MASRHDREVRAESLNLRPSRPRDKSTHPDSPLTGPVRLTAVLAAQRFAGNRAVSRLLATPAAFGFVVQRKNAEGTDYLNAEKREAIEHAKKTLTKGKKTPKPKDAAEAMADFLVKPNETIATNYKDKKVLAKACLEWWNKPSLVEDPVALAERRALVDPRLEYDREHGKYHFQKVATAKKSAWSLSEVGANALVVAAIRKHLKALGEHSSDYENQQGWSAFYIVDGGQDVIGSYAGNGGGTTKYFTIQLQVNYEENLISYHGYPDEEVGAGEVGCSFKKGGPTLST